MIGRGWTWLSMFERASARAADPLMFLVRAYWGYGFYQTGLGKLVNLEATTAFFASLGIPFPEANAMLVGGIEMTGGILFVLGLGARVAAVPLLGILATAFATDEREALLQIVSDPGAITSAVPFPFLLAAALVLAYGPGAWSLDEVIARWRRRASSHGDTVPEKDDDGLSVHTTG